jgi:hypothetical protein
MSPLIGSKCPERRSSSSGDTVATPTSSQQGWSTKRKQRTIVGQRCSGEPCHLASRLAGEPMLRRDTLNYLPWVVSGICFVASLCFPAHTKTIWILDVATLLPFLWQDLKRPVNYFSLDSLGFVFQLHPGMKTAARWADVKEVFYCRSFNSFASQIDRNGSSDSMMAGC